MTTQPLSLEKEILLRKEWNKALAKLLRPISGCTPTAIRFIAATIRQNRKLIDEYAAMQQSFPAKAPSSPLVEA